MVEGKFNEAQSPWDHLLQISDLDDGLDKSIITPKQRLNNLKLPEGLSLSYCFLVYVPALFNYMTNQKNIIKTYNLACNAKLCLFTAKKKTYAVVLMPVGASASAMVLEELHYLGFLEYFIFSIGGGIKEGLKSGDLCLIEQAIINEGVSLHYNKRDFFSHGSFALLKQLKDICDKANIAYNLGCTWTTDGFYRETEAKLAFMKKKQILCVDMEFSALFSVALYYKLKLSGLIAVADTIKDKQWGAEFELSKVLDKARLVFDQIIC